MDVALTVFRLLLLLCSVCGWMILLKRVTRMNSAFLPGVTLAGMTVILFSCGLVGFLAPASMVLYAGGLGLLICFLVTARRRGFSLAFLWSPGMIFFFLSALILLPLLWGARFYHYDNFSHWATVLYEMLAFDSFPTPETVTMFTTYPPGSASFLYFFCRAVGTAEHVALLGQGILSAALLSALFFRVRSVPSYGFATASFLALVVTCLLVFDDGTLQIFSLLVDAQMGFAAVLIWCLRESYLDHPSRGWVAIAPVLILLVLMKANGFLFWGLFVLLMVYDALKRTPAGERRLVFLPIAASVLWYCLWKVYHLTIYDSLRAALPYLILSVALLLLVFVILRFGSRLILRGKPALIVACGGVTLLLILLFVFRTPIATAISDFWAERSQLEFSHLFSQLWDKITDFSNRYVHVFAVLNALSLSVYFILRKRNKKGLRLKRAIIISNLFMVAYTLCLMSMYCFFMSVSEAAYLAAFDRYIITPLILFVVMQAAALFESLSYAVKDRGRLLRLLPICVSLVLFLLVAPAAKQLLVRPSFESTERGQVITALDEASDVIPRGARVALFNGDRGRRDLYYYLMVFQLKTRACFDLDYGSPEYSIDVDTKMLLEYEWLIVADSDPQLHERLREAGFAVEWEDSCTLYRIEDSRIFPARS